MVKDNLSFVKIGCSFVLEIDHDSGKTTYLEIQETSTNKSHPNPPPNLPGFAAGFHLVGQFHILGVNIELPLPLTEDSRQHGSRVDSHSHVNGRIGLLLDVSVGQ